MITLYGKKYAANNAEFTSTLFDAGGTANGYYKVRKNGIYLIDMQGNERAFIRKDGLGPVSIGRNHKGKRFYGFAASTFDEKWLGVPDSYSEQVEGAEELAGRIYEWLID